VRRTGAIGIALLAPLFAADAVAPAPATDEIVARMIAADQARTPKLREYESIRRYTLDNTRFGTHASMTVRMTYRYPGVKNFQIIEQKGPGPVRSKVFNRMIESEREAASEAVRATTQIIPRNYTFRLLDSQTVDGRRCFVLDAEPKTPNKFLFRGRVFVDAEDFAVARIEGAPAQSPSFWVRKTAFVHRYGKFGPFWLALSNQSDTDVIVFGHTRVKIEYGEYKIRSEEGPVQVQATN
jgi:hypothetical protein